MLPFLAILAVTIVAALAQWRLQAIESRIAWRGAGLAGVIALLPLLALGVIWPSAFTVLALVALPAAVIGIVRLMRPKLAATGVARGYTLTMSAVAVLVSALQVVMFEESRFVVPEGFSGPVVVVYETPGAELAPTTWGTTVFLIPNSGVAPFANVSVSGWVKVVRRDSGTKIPSCDSGSKWSDACVRAFRRSGQSHADGNVAENPIDSFVVGPITDEVGILARLREMEKRARQQ